MNDSTTIPAIDVHAHYGSYVRDNMPLINKFSSGTPDEVVARARQSNTRYTVVSPLLGLLPRGGGKPVEGNVEAAGVVGKHEELLQWVIVDPQVSETYRQAEQMLQSDRCVGIKIHPEEHRYHIKDHGDAIFEFAAEHHAVVLAHSGDPLSMPLDFVPFANAYPEMKLILAHLGNNGMARDPSQQVRAIQASTNGNIYTDTSSASSILPRLIEWAVQEISFDRILYGTDTPLYFAPMQRTRIDNAEISLDAKKAILHENAEALLGLQLNGIAGAASG